jgi:hypothetical protein
MLPTKFLLKPLRHQRYCLLGTILNKVFTKTIKATEVLYMLTTTLNKVPSKTMKATDEVLSVLDTILNKAFTKTIKANEVMTFAGHYPEKSSF